MDQNKAAHRKLPNQQGTSLRNLKIKKKYCVFYPLDVDSSYNQSDQYISLKNNDWIPLIKVTLNVTREPIILKIWYQGLPWCITY